MAFGDCYRYYTYDKKRLNFLVYRTSDKCFRVLIFGYSLHGLKTQIQQKTFRSWLSVEVFAEGFIKEVL